MENKLKTFLKPHLGLIVLIALAVFAFTIFFVQSGCETAEFNRAIDNQSNQSNKAVQEAVNANNAAVNVSIERRTEDAVREQVITPKLEQSRRRSANSAIALEAARKTYNEKKTHTANLSTSDADNCRELLRLFPNVRFADCAGR